MSRVLDKAFDSPRQLEEHATGPLAGGIMQHGYQCGMIWGSAMAAGAEAFKRFGDSPKAEAMAIKAAGRIVEAFRKGNDHINCLEIIEIDKTSTGFEMFVFFLLKGGAIGCIKRAARFAPTAYREIEAAFSDLPDESAEGPVSCATIVARKMGATDEQAIMAAGFAGGIGLCGGACGALGAAIWMTAMKSGQANEGKIDFNDARAQETIDRFMKSSDCEFECSKIVGSEFESVKDHSDYIRDGGCAKLIETLAGE